MLSAGHVGVCSSGGDRILPLPLIISLLVLFNPLSAELVFMSSVSEAITLGTSTESQFQSRSITCVDVDVASIQFERQWYPCLHHDAHLLGMPNEEPFSELIAYLPRPLERACVLRGRSIEPQSHPPNIYPTRFSLGNRFKTRAVPTLCTPIVQRAGR